MPERSHILKTWPTNAGPPPFPVEMRIVEGNPEAASEEGALLMDEDDEDWGILERVEGRESGAAESEGEVSERAESGKRRGRWILEGGGGEFGPLMGRKEDRLAAAAWKKPVR